MMPSSSSPIESSCAEHSMPSLSTPRIALFFSTVPVAGMTCPGRARTAFMPACAFAAPQTTRIVPAPVSTAQTPSRSALGRGATAVPRALVNHDTAGVTKLVADAATGALLGASVVGEGAGDVIQSAVLAIRHHVTAAELAATFHPYLTTAESLKLAAQAFTRDVARLSCCAA